MWKSHNTTTTTTTPLLFLLPLQVVMIKREKRDKYLEVARELNKTMEHESEDDTNCNWHDRHGQQWIGTGTGGLRNKRTSLD